MKKVNISILIFLFIYNLAPGQKNFYERLSDSAIALTKVQVAYDPGYYVMDYPNGDVPADKGVCTDVIIRAYRKMGIDLQKEVHEDMIKNFKKYPDIWGLTHTDKNIDHRRVPNLMVFFTRHGTVKAITKKPADYLPGDIVCWNLGGDVSHIGLVVNKKSSDGKRFMIVHNIGQGQVIEDCLFQHKITGHFRYNN